MTKPLVIIGSGLAAYMTAKEWRKHDSSTPLHIITAADGAFYSKPLLSNSLIQGRDADQVVTSTCEQMAKQLDAQIITHTKITDLDVATQVIRWKKGESCYQNLVLAIGAKPFAVPLLGDAVDQVMSINELADYKKFREVLQEGSHVTIMGSGLVGCELANDLILSGYQVTVVSLDDYPLQRFIPREAGLLLQEALAQAGVVWHFKSPAQAVNQAEHKMLIVSTQQQSWETNIVISAAGLCFEAPWLQKAGVACGSQGIMVNGLLSTSQPCLYALGDCADYQGVGRRYIAPILHAARALGQTLAGSPVEVSFPLMPIKVKTSVLPMMILSPAGGIEVTWQQAEDNVILAKDAQGNIKGFVLLAEAIKNQRIWLAEVS